MNSTLTKNQKMTLTKILENGDRLVATIRYDDECGNGHNSFAITCDLYNKRGQWEAGGCLHDQFIKAFPEYAHLVKWHLCSSDGPMHYIANTLYWVKEENLDYARSSAIAPNATPEQLRDKQWLENRLPSLLVEFKADVESLGFIW